MSNRIRSRGWVVVNPSRLALALAILVSATLPGGVSRAVSGHPETGLVISRRYDPTNDPIAYFGMGLASGDFNGDGYSDIVSGAPRSDLHRDDDGSAYVYMGSSDGLSRSPTILQPKSQKGANFGDSASIGDINNDGFDDAVIGAPSWDGEGYGEGATFVYMGSPRGLSDPHTRRMDPTDRYHQFFGLQVTIGDANGDGFDEVFVMQASDESDDGTLWVYSGASFGLRKKPLIIDSPRRNEDPYLGFDSVEYAGDVNGDNFGDLLASSGARVYVFPGSHEGIQPESFQTLLHPDGDRGFARSIASAGDLNSDGLNDVLVAGYEVTTNSEYVYLYLGSESDLEPHKNVAESPAAGDGSEHFGVEMAAAGDLDDDGFGDVVISASDRDGQFDAEGSAYLFLGSESGWEVPPAETFQVKPKYFTRFGYRVTSAGDVDGDGRDDLAIAATHWSSKKVYSEGRLFVFTRP